jgi:hypothetical protein
MIMLLLLLLNCNTKNNKARAKKREVEHLNFSSLRGAMTLSADGSQFEKERSHGRTRRRARSVRCCLFVCLFELFVCLFELFVCLFELFVCL